MNIFVLDYNPGTAATMQCDKHVVKMVLETGQMLATAHHILDGVNLEFPKKTHENHPCSIWVRQSNRNYEWLADHFLALLQEYTFRYNKVHAWDKYKFPFMKVPKKIPSILNLTPRPLCMPDEYKADDVVQSYRNYYIGDKARFAKWAKTRSAPDWWKI